MYNILNRAAINSSKHFLWWNFIIIPSIKYIISCVRNL